MKISASELGLGIAHVEETVERLPIHHPTLLFFLSRSCVDISSFLKEQKKPRVCRSGCYIPNSLIFIVAYTVHDCGQASIKVDARNTKGTIHSSPNALSYENAYVLMRFRLSSTLKRPTTLMKTEAFENGFKSLLKTHRFENAPFIVWIGENRAAFENDAETSDVSISIFGVRFNSMDNRRKRVKKNPFSYENVFLGEMFFLVFVETKRDTFKNAAVWWGPQSSCNF